MTAQRSRSEHLRHGLALAIAVASVGLGSGCEVLVELIETDTDVEASDAAGEADARDDGGELPVDADVECTTWSYSPEHFDPCEIPPPNGALTLTAGLWTYDTNSGALTDPVFDATFPASALLPQSSGPEVRVISADAITVEAGAVLQAAGKRPLVLVSWSTIEVEGAIDVTSRAALAGAGSDPTGCPVAGVGDDNPEGAGGGGGGGFGAGGADGGTGLDGSASAGVGSGASAVPAAVRGGCAGASGGNPTGGHGGSGGGALQLTARGSIEIVGTLHAGGAGGGGAQGGRGGGGGGGSGGYVGLQAPLVTLTASAVLAANGGGGGGGCDNKNASPGQEGQADAVAALGGDGEGQGKAGGPGGFSDTSPGPGIASSRGGGGGGGGVGYVLLWTETLDQDGSAIVSPAAIQP